MYSLSAEMIAIVICLAAWKGVVWSAPLQQHDESESAIRCSQPALLRHSSTECQLPPGSTFVAYCTFTFSPSGSQPNITWFYDKKPIGSLNRTSTVSIEWGNSSHYSTGSLPYVTTNISIANISSADHGVYRARVSNLCGAEVECNISLSTLNHCYSVTPTVESAECRRTLVVPESHQVSILANYSGNTDPVHFDVRWQLNNNSNSNSDLVGTDKVGKFRSNRTLRDDRLCSFTEVLTISDASYLDSGFYTAYVSPLQNTSDASSTNVTFDLQIIPWPTVTVWPEKSVQLKNSDKMLLSYHLANYTKYINLSLVKDDAVISQTEDGMVIRHDPFEHKNITVNVMIPEGATGQYKLCYEFTGNVSIAPNQRRKWCTKDTVVTTELPKSKESFRSLATALGVAIGLSMIVFAACVAFFCKLKSGRKERSRNPPSEETHLIPNNKAPDDIDVSTDCGGRGLANYETTGRSTNTSLWKKVPVDVISMPNVVVIAREVKHWEPLARCLGLRESDIVAIREDNKGSYEEQKYQMILKWRERSGSQATLRRLVRCVEEELVDREVAERIAFI